MSAPDVLTIPGFAPQSISLPVIPTPSGSAQATLVGSGPPAPPVLTGLKQVWLLRTHPEYDGNIDKWTMATEHYNGQVLEPDRVIKYLPRKQQAESIEGYRERTALADYTPHFATVVDSLAGMLFSAEAETNRDWGDLGDPDDPATTAGRLMADVDGSGQNLGWISLWKQCTADLLVVHRVWVLCDSAENDTGDVMSRVLALPVQAVRNWRMEKGHLVEALVAEIKDERQALDEARNVPFKYTFVHYFLDGWRRWTLDKNQRPVLVGEGTHSFTDRHGNPALPLFMINLPLRRHVGWMLARKANAIFNKQSEMDHLLRSAALSIKLNIFADASYLEQIRADLVEKGSMVLGNPKDGKGHHYIAPESGPVTVALEAHKRRVEEFYKTAFREYSESARGLGSQRTATEVRQEIHAGSGAILQLVKGSLDDAENEALWRLEQIEFPRDQTKWFKASVERTDNFAPTDPDAAIDNILKRYFSDPRIPVGRKAMIAAVHDALFYDGYDIDEVDVESAVDSYLVQRALAVEQQLPLGAEARAEITIRWVQSLGMFDWEEPLDTGAVDPLTGKPVQGTRGEIIANEIRAVARAQMQSEIRGASYMPGQQALGGGTEAEGAKPGQPGGNGGGGPPRPGASKKGASNPEIHLHLPGGGKKVITTKRTPTGFESQVSDGEQAAGQ